MLKKLACCLFISFSFPVLTQSQSVNTDSLITELSKAKEDTNKVNLLRTIGVGYAHQHPQKAISYWKQGVELSKKLGYDMGLARSYINIGTGYSFIGKFDSAIIYADSSIVYCHKIKDVSRLALAYLNKADSYRNLQEFKKALILCDTALSYAEQAGNTDRLARISDIISDIYAAQKQFSSSISYLNKALEYYRKDENALMVGQVYSDFADIYKQMDQHDKAISFYKLAIHIADSVQDLKNLSTYYGDLADLYINQGKYTEAELSAGKSLEYARQQENNLQLATTYTHLSNLYLNQKRFKEAIEAGNNAYRLAGKENNLMWQKESARSLAEAYKETQDYNNAYQFLLISKNLNDSMMEQRFGEELAGLQNSFEIKGKDKEIQLLNKDKELQQQKLSRQRVLVAGSVVLVLLSLTGIGLLISRYRLRQRMKELQLRNEIAADLHDEVGSSLSSIYMLSEMASAKRSPDDAQKEILDKVSGYTKETMDKMGDIVWMIKPVGQDGPGLKERIQLFLREMCNSRNIECSFDGDALNDLKLTMHQKKGLYLVFKEAVNNAIKYAEAKKISVKVEQGNQKIKLVVKDDGKGFDVNMIKKGNGLDNMQNRAKELGGHTMISSAAGEGTTVSFVMVL